MLPRHHSNRGLGDGLFIGWNCLLNRLVLSVFNLYLKLSIRRYTVDDFLHGVPFVCPVAYFIPDNILDHTTFGNFRSCSLNYLLLV